MAFINENFLKLSGNYLFAEIARKVTEFKKNNIGANVIKLGIGDVTKPLIPSVIEGLHKAVNDMSDEGKFMGYGPYEGYDFLIKRIIDCDYNSLGVSISQDEVFISDGAKSDTSCFQEIFGTRNKIAVTDPVYPVYVDSNVMAGRTGEVNSEGIYNGINYLPCTAENDFVPELPAEKVDLIYLCLPNNPTGTTLTKGQLKVWVDYARKNKAIILFDAAYEAFITENDIPHSIYEIEGAKEVAIEFRSFSKTAGFTGTRCAYTVVPKEVVAYDSGGREHMLNSLWYRRQATKFNGVSYIIQKGAAAIYTDEGQKQVKDTINYYMENAGIIKRGLESIGLKVYGAVNAPYIWLKTPNNMDSWTFFDKLLKEVHIVGTPGDGFGPSGKGYFRLTAFGEREIVEEAVERFKTRLKI